ncbi:hypothetical protein GOEFS_050_00250 [Gordonia effusa NBRC 100432]|uniref:Uncharacterized protein n=1 Tax=Gordonia effusa NBRC 100432 TaxID=1077974 RepID=H0QZJ6_9ACTN|nr:hypothetical protein GOEFS_050_00250 [Gordonia effusa NBRC 100432]
MPSNVGFANLPLPARPNRGFGCGRRRIEALGRVNALAWFYTLRQHPSGAGIDDVVNAWHLAGLPDGHRSVTVEAPAPMSGIRASRRIDLGEIPPTIGVVGAAAMTTVRPVGLVVRTHRAITDKNPAFSQLRISIFGLSIPIDMPNPVIGQSPTTPEE